MFKKVVVCMVIGCLAVSVSGQPAAGGRPQGVGSVSGILVDGSTNEPIEYGNIVLLQAKDSVMIAGTVSDGDGLFSMKEVPFGRYTLKVSFIGYETISKPDIRVIPKEANLNLGELKLNPKAILVDEITVSGEKPAIVNKLDKKVVNVEALIPGGSGTAVDVMQQVPSVQVDQEGNISLRGNGNVTILIDGKQASIEGMSSGDILNSIPVSSIETVEIITNPSVRYDPEGTSGIVNIILKHKQESGYLSTISANAGNDSRYNGSLNGNYRMDNLNWFGSFDARSNPFRSSGTSTRETFSPSGSTFLNQINSNTNQMGGFSGRFGADWAFSEFKSLTTSVNTRQFSFDNNGNTATTIRDESGAILREFENDADANRQMLMIQGAISFAHKGKLPDDRWNVDLNIRRFGFDRTEDVDQTNRSPVPGFASSTQSASKNRGYHTKAEANYSVPLGFWGVFETGTSYSVRTLTLENNRSVRFTESGPLTPLQDGSYQYDYLEGIGAIYLSNKRSFGSFQILSGLRGEFTDFSLESAGPDANSAYSDWFPSIHISKSISPVQDVQVSYSRRVDRPNNRDLNPAIDYADSLNLRSGNAALAPQYINAYEASHSINLPVVSINTTLFFRQVTGLISQSTTLIDTLITFTRPENTGTRETAGLELGLSGNPAKWMRWNGSWSGFQNKIYGVRNGTDTETFTWLLKLNTFYTLPWDLQLQLTGNYDSPSIEPQREVSESWGVDASLRRDFLNGTLSATMRISDLFDSRDRRVLSDTPTFRSDSYNKWESQTIFLGLSWRISENYKPRTEQNRERNQDSEDF